MPITHAKVSAKSDGGDATLVRPSDWNDDHVGATAALLLDYTYAGSDHNGASMTGGADFDVCPNQSFTVGAATSLIEIAVRANAQCHRAGGDALIVTYAIIDSAGTPITKKVGGSPLNGSIYLNPFTGSGSIFLSLAAGSHTIKIALRPSATADLYLRPSAGDPYEFLSVQVIEHGA
jgi:hypothetical protein